MSATGTPNGKAIRKTYTSVSSADTTTWAAGPNMANWAEIVGAGTRAIHDLQLLEGDPTERSATQGDQTALLAAGKLAEHRAASVVGWDHTPRASVHDHDRAQSVVGWDGACRRQPWRR